MHLHGSFAVTKAAWPHLVNQKFGRIIMTASAAGLYGNFGQANYSAAKMALVGFAKSLAREGSKYNITCNVIVPLAATRISETALPPDVLKVLKPEALAPLVSYLVHENSSHENGSVFESAGGCITKLRYQRSAGILINGEEQNPTPISDLLLNLRTLENFSTSPTYPSSITDTPWMDLVEKSSKLPLKVSGKSQDEKILSGHAIIVTGAGGGLGKAYALLLSSLGASVLVNDLSKKAALDVVSQIRAKGGIAEANFDNVIDQGKAMVDQALRQFGRLDGIVNNAGILRDKSFSKQTAESWKLVIDVHLRGAYSLCHAAWPIFVKQNYGRIINTTSAVGLYGNFGQSNYAAAKAGIIGLSKTLAIEGAKHNIKVNVIAPNAGTAMTATIMPNEVVEVLKPSYVAPLVALLASKDHCPTNGSVFEAGSGWFSMVRLERSKGVVMHPGFGLVDLSKAWSQISTFGGQNSTFPSTIQESIEPILLAIQSRGTSATSSPNDHGEEVSFTYSERDLILYALGIGCNEKQLNWVYERDGNFRAFPTFGVIPGLSALFTRDGTGPSSWADSIPKFNLMSLLHGEQKLEIFNQIPTKGTLISHVTVVNISQKGPNALIVLRVDSKEQGSGKLIFSNESTLVLRGLTLSPEQITSATSSNSGQEKLPFESGPIKRSMKKTFQTVEGQAVLYRLSGDLNPLHIDPSMAAMGGFKKPILHGLCTFGIAARQIVEALSDSSSSVSMKLIKGRFSRPVYPGETLVTNINVRAEDKHEIHVTFTTCTSTDSAPVLSNGYAILTIHAENVLSVQDDGMQKKQSSEVVSKLAMGWNLLSAAAKEELVTKVSVKVMSFKNSSIRSLSLRLNQRNPFGLFSKKLMVRRLVFKQTSKV